MKSQSNDRRLIDAEDLAGFSQEYGGNDALDQVVPALPIARPSRIKISAADRGDQGSLLP